MRDQVVESGTERHGGHEDYDRQYGSEDGRTNRRSVSPRGLKRNAKRSPIASESGTPAVVASRVIAESEE